MTTKNNIPKEVQDFQRNLFGNYKSCLTLPEPYQYLYGNPVQPVVPLDVAQHGVFILGAYPSARFASIRSERDVQRDVPVGDNCGPFSTERYFDGSRIRTVDSGKELEDKYLAPLGLKREQCWITDLVRVFLFKEGHITKYRKLNCPLPLYETRSKFEDFAKEGFCWLEDELEIAQPRLVITLGSEVAGILRQVKGQGKRNDLLYKDAEDISIGKVTCKAIHLAHPGIVMRPATDQNPWPRLHEEKIITYTQVVHNLLQ
jgi:uracil-DNA glycosylase